MSQSTGTHGAPAAPRGDFGPVELIAIGVGGMIGGGIFSVLGLAVQVSGRAAALAFGVGSLVALAAAYSYVRLALTFRKDGASFTYLEMAFPRSPSVAGVAGWTVVVGYIGTLALYAFTFGAYSAHLFGVEHVRGARGALSVFSLLFFLAINLSGNRTMGRAEDIAVYLKIALLGILGGVGFFTAEPGHLMPRADHGAAAIFLGGALIFVAYEGFQLITNAVQETRDPDRNLPRSIYASILITSAIYISIATVAVGNLDPAKLLGAGEYALAEVARPILGRLGVVLVDIAAMLATSSAINATLFGASHLANEMAQDNLAPRALSTRTPDGVPARAAIGITTAALLLTMLGSLELIASFSSMTFLLVSMGVCVANFILRRRTSSAVLPILLGLVLMGTTVVLLIRFLMKSDHTALVFIGVAYVAVGLTFAAFRFIVNRDTRRHGRADLRS
ncbi:MAG: APC family permease [Gemmatimonadota bacterium]